MNEAYGAGDDVDISDEDAEELATFCDHFALESRGQGLSTCVELALQQLLRQKRKAPSHQERTEAYRQQDGRCGHCACEIDGEEEFDHIVPVRDAVEGQPVLWRALCKPCHALLTDREAARRNPLLSSFTPHLYDAFVLSPKPVPCTFCRETR